MRKLVRNFWMAWREVSSTWFGLWMRLIRWSIGGISILMLIMLARSVCAAILDVYCWAYFTYIRGMDVSFVADPETLVKIATLALLFMAVMISCAGFGVFERRTFGFMKKHAFEASITVVVVSVAIGSFVDPETTGLRLAVRLPPSFITVILSFGIAFLLTLFYGFCKWAYRKLLTWRYLRMSIEEDQGH